MSFNAQKGQAVEAILPSKLFSGYDGVMLGERFIFDDGCNMPQQASDGGTHLIRFGRRAVLVFGPIERLHNTWTFGDHGVFWKMKNVE